MIEERLDTGPRDWKPYAISIMVFTVVLFLTSAPAGFKLIFMRVVVSL